MIYTYLASQYGPARAESILLEAMSLLGRLPHAQFLFLERDSCPRVSCPNSTVWFSYLCEDDLEVTEVNVGGEDCGSNFTVELFEPDSPNVRIFRSDVLELMARTIEGHERNIKAAQASDFALDQLGIDTGIRRHKNRLS